MKRIIGIFLLLFIINTPIFSQDIEIIDNSEIINGFRIEMDKIVFTVFNSGYTDKSSFILNIDNKEGIYEIELIRVIDDFGKMIPEPIEVIFTQEELGDRINIKNNIKILNLFCFNKI